MMGIYPVNPAEPMYAITKPTFKKVTIHLDNEYYNGRTLELISNTFEGKNSMDKIWIDGKSHNSYFISHDKLINAGKIEFILM